MQSLSDAGLVDLDSKLEVRQAVGYLSIVCNCTNRKRMVFYSLKRSKQPSMTYWRMSAVIGEICDVTFVRAAAFSAKCPIDTFS